MNYQYGYEESFHEDEIVYYEGWNAAESDLKKQVFSHCPYNEEYFSHNFSLWTQGYDDRVNDPLCGKDI